LHSFLNTRSMLSEKQQSSLVPGFELSNMNWGGVEKFLHGWMSRPELFEPKNPIKS